MATNDISTEQAPVSEAEQLLAILTQYRGILKPIAIDIKNIKAHAYFTTGQVDNADGKGLVDYGGKKPDRGEMIANIMLSYRHMEDARMRLGKVFEAYFGEGIGDGPLNNKRD